MNLWAAETYLIKSWRASTIISDFTKGTCSVIQSCLPYEKFKIWQIEEPSLKYILIQILLRHNSAWRVEKEGFLWMSLAEWRHCRIGFTSLVETVDRLPYLTFTHDFQLQLGTVISKAIGRKARVRTCCWRSSISDSNTLVPSAFASQFVQPPTEETGNP